MARCPDCGFPTEDPDAPCDRCGFQVAVAVGTTSPPPESGTAGLVPVEARWSRPQGAAFVEGEYYLPVPISKLILLSLMSLGLYQFYWFYRQWRFLKDSGEPELEIWPRVVFTGIFAYSLFRRVREHADGIGIPIPWGPGLLAFCYIAIPLVAYFSGWSSLVALLNVLALVPVQRTMNEVNLASVPPVAPNGRYTGGELLALMPGAFFILVYIFIYIANALFSA